MSSHRAPSGGARKGTRSTGRRVDAGSRPLRRRLVPAALLASMVVTGLVVVPALADREAAGETIESGQAVPIGGVEEELPVEGEVAAEADVTELPSPEPGDVPAPEPSPMPTGPEPAEVPSPEPSEMPSPEPSEVPGPEPSEVPGPEPAGVPPTPAAEVDGGEVSVAASADEERTDAQRG